MYSNHLFSPVAILKGKKRSLKYYFLFFNPKNFIFMKRFSFLMAFALCFGMAFGQNHNKIDPALQNALNLKAESNSFRVIVTMTERFNNTQLNKKTRFMDKAQRRAFVINERKAFCQDSQSAVMEFLNNVQASEVKTFWSFNGFSCTADAETILQLSERKDIAMIYSDELKLMLPEREMRHPATSKGNGWHVNKINAPEVWNYNGTGYTGNGVIVAMLDSGLNYDHIDIVNSLWDGGTDFPLHGYDFINDDHDPMDDHGHGSHTAGIVAGQGTSGTQTGVAPGAKLMILKVIDAEGEGGDSHLISGAEFAMEHGADILNISLCASGAGACSFYRDIFITAMEAGVVVAAAAGNEAQQQYAFPVPFNIGAPGNCPPPWLHPDQKRLVSGGLSAVISVGATDSNDAHCDFSSVGPVTWAYGQYVGNYNDYPYENGDAAQPGLIRPDLSAPGANITSLNYATNNGYIEFDGTSMATPCVSGVLALLLEADPELTPAQLDSIIELTSAKAGNNAKNNRVGAGRLDALAAMNALFHHGPTNLTAEYDGYEVVLNWAAAPEAVSYQIYRDGIRIANNLTSTTYFDHISFGGFYTYYVIATLANDMTSLPSNYATVVKATEIEADIINNSKVALSWNLPPSIVDGFESGDFYQNMWMIDQTYPWEISTNTPHEGSYCAKSTNTGMYTTSKISLAVSVPTNCLVSYHAKISCFPLNGGGFFIDNIQHGETIKDDMPWTQFTAPLSPGNHILEWKYANQLDEGEYENAFYIDDITVGNPFNIYRTNCDGSEVTLIATSVAAAQYVDNGWDALPIGEYKYGVSNDGGATITWSDCLSKDILATSENAQVELKLFPNPAQDQLIIECVAAHSVSIVSILGQTMFEGTMASESMTVSLADFPAGLYLIRVESEKGLITKHLSVVK